MGRKLLLWAALLTVATALVAAPAASAALTQLPGTAGCVSHHGEGGCAVGRAISEADGPLAISPDGKSAYLVADSSPEGIEGDAILVFDRDPATGALAQKPGTEGCIAAHKRDGCEADIFLGGASEAVVSPDGRNVYVAATTGVIGFDRDPATGALSAAGGFGQCLSSKSSNEPCVSGVGTTAADSLAVSPDGHELYVANDDHPTVAILRRDPLTGRLSQKHGKAGCVFALKGPYKCATRKKPEGSTFGIVAAADGHSVYVVTEGETAAGAGTTGFAAFARNGAGALRLVGNRAGCLHQTDKAACPGGRGLREVEGLALSSDGTSLYATSGFGFSSKAGAVTIYHRSGNALGQSPGAAGCISANGGECAADKALAGAEDVAASPDGANVYVTTLYGLAILDRDPTGALTPPAGTAACLSDFKKFCTPARNLEATDGVAVSPEGTNVYVTSLEPGGVSTFTR